MPHLWLPTRGETHVHEPEVGLGSLQREGWDLGGMGAFSLSCILTCTRFNGNWVDSRDFQIRYKFKSFFLLLSFPFMISAIYATASGISPEVGTPGPGGSVASCTSTPASYAACL